MSYNRLAQLMVVSAMLATGCVAQAQSRLMRYADVHKDQIVFTYEGDLWLVSSEGGEARRITRDPGPEVLAKFSPDGSKLAFTAQYDGGLDVYVMDARGGVPRRLTFHPAIDQVLGWFPDGKHVLFRSRRVHPARTEQIYKVSIDGGLPERLPVDRAGLTAISPDGKSIAYNRITRERRTWKRHQGGTAQDLWLGSLDKGDFKKITDWKGTDNFPMWVGEAIYFTSDREHGTLNIYKYDVGSGKIAAMTSYKDYDVKFPSIGVGQIVYQYGGALHLLNIKTGKTQPVPIELASDLVRMRPEFVEVEPKTGSFNLSPSGKRLLLEARGEILNLPVEDGEPINLTRTSGTREKNAAWSPDGRWVAFISDQTGEEEAYLIDQKGEKEWKQLTTGGFGFRMQPVWSPDSKHLLFADKFMRLNLVDAESGDVTVIDQGELDDGWERWGIQDYVWSADSKWVAYTKMEQSQNESVFLYSMKDRKIHRVTDDLTPDWSPSFDPEGKYLYFLSNRTFDPIMGFIEQNYVFLDMCRPYVVLLQADEPTPFAPKDSEEEVEEPAEEPVEEADEEGAEDPDEEAAEDQADEQDESEQGDEDKGEDDGEGIQIDIEGIARRIVAAEDVPAGNYFRLEATKKGFLYLRRDENPFEKYQNVNDHTADKLDLYSYDLKKGKTKKVLSGIANYHLSADGKKLVYRSGSTYGVVEAGSKASVGDGKVKLGEAHVEVDRRQEFVQIFNEAWRVQRDWFYDPDMHGVDWEAMGAKYRKLVPHCGTRSDLNYLIGEMISELNIGHTYIFGGDIAREGKSVRTGLLGVDFAVEPGADYYRIAHIIPGTPWKPSEQSPLATPGCPVKEGDYLIAIDGREVRTADNPFRYLQNKPSKVVTLTYNDKPSAEEAKTCRVKTIKSERPIRYREWVDRNRAYVDKASNGQIGYLHIPDMGQNGLKEFAPFYLPHHYKKAFVIDERYNGGGFTSDMIIQRLERKVWAYTQPREGMAIPEPERGFHGHLVVLINEDTGSSGEWFAEGIKRKGICPLIGMRTWGGAVGIELHQPLMDGGRTTPPQFGPYGLDRTWLIEGYGVDPDIEVQNMPGDVVRGQDAQLDTAIEHLTKRIEEDPRDMPPRPAYPDKSKKN